MITIVKHFYLLDLDSDHLRYLAVYVKWVAPVKYITPAI